MNFTDLFVLHPSHGYILQILFAELLFFPFFKRRKHFVLRAVFSFAFYVVCSIRLTNLLNQVIKGLSSITIFLLSFLGLIFCFENKVKDLLFCCVGAQLIQNLSHNIENLIYLPLKNQINTLGWFFLSASVRLVLYGLCFFMIYRFSDLSKGVNLSGGGVFPIAVFSARFCYLLQFLLQVYEIDGLWVTRLPLGFCDIISLRLQFGLLGYKNKVDENIYLERFINQSNKYYESVKNNIDVLNRKAHDLKHFINDFKERGNRSEEELRELEKTVNEYECSPKTGNKALDTVLSEKTYICNNQNIPFYIRVKEDLLGFLRIGDLTSLFGNLLDNAIEYEEKVEDVKQRFILLKICRKGHIISVHIENYCNTSVQFKDGLPLSTKGDNRYHGFGVKSICYIVKKYNGNIRFYKENDIYNADIIFPVPEEDNVTA